MQNLLLGLFTVGAAFLIFYLWLPFVTTLLAQFFPKKEKILPAAPISAKNIDFGCVITCYKNADIARPLIESLLRQTHQNFCIYLLADECPKLEWTFDDARFRAFQPDPPLRLKAKSIIYAMENFQRKHDFTVVFDGDNLAHPDFLENIQKYIHSGYQAVQGQRTAKNLDSKIAATDSIGEFYKNWVERVVPFRLGSSAVISGSGMAVETELYWAYLRSPEIERGKHLWKKMLQEDKILQNFLLRKNEKIAYAWEAICFDEKVETSAAIETQRSRWLYSYFQNTPNSLGLIRRGLTNFSWNQLLFGLLTFGLPMFILLGFSVVFAIIGLFFSQKWSILLLAGCTIFSLNVLWTLRLSNVPPSIWAGLLKIPTFIGRQFLGLFKMFNPNKNFKHTEQKQTVSIEEILKK